MALQLDMRTIFLSLVFGHIFTVILISAYWRSHKKDTTLNTFFIAKCVQSIAWFFLALRGGIPDIFTISLANTLLFLGVSFETIAILKLQRAFYPSTKKIYICLTILSILGFHFIILFNNLENIRIAFASIGTAVLIIIPAYRLIQEKNTSILKRIMGYLYLLVIVSLIVRALASILSEQSMGLFTPGFYQTFSFLALYLVMILGNTGFVLLLKEQGDQEILRLARYDDLTNTLNRRTFVAFALDSLHIYAKLGNPVSLLLFDVDHFKTINDTHGHVIGDRVLQDLTMRINEHLREEDLFGRYGGDEFAILLPGLDEMESTVFAEGIRRMIDKDGMDQLSVRYTLSIGLLTVIPDQHTELEALYITCDKALYTAKQNGRNRVSRSQYTHFQNRSYI